MNNGTLLDFFTDEELVVADHEHKSHVDLPEKTIKFSVISGDDHTTAEIFEVTFDELRESCQEPRISDTKKGKAFSPTIFKNNYRNDENARECSFLVFDLDEMPESITPEDVLTCIEGINSFCYTTFRHKLENFGNRFRVIVDIHKPIPARKYKTIAEHFSKKFEYLNGKIDTTGFSPAQYFYFPACSSERIKYFDFKFQSGEVFDWESISFTNTVETIDKLPNKSDSQSVTIKEGERNNTLLKIGYKKCRSFKNESEIEDFLYDYNSKYCLPPLELYEVNSIAKSVSEYIKKSNLQLTEEGSLTELALANSVISEHKKDILWISEWQSWVRFDEIDCKWYRADQSIIGKLIIDDLKSRRAREAELIRQTGANRAIYIREIERAEKSSFISGTEKLMRNVQIIKKTPSDFDANSYLFGLSDGYCFDLDKLEHRKTTREDYLTKSINASYDPNATCPLWEKSLIEWCRGDKELVLFLQTWCGYSLSGLSELQMFLFLYGDGKNGKSVFVNTISELIGQYSVTINPETLMLYNQSNKGASGDVARLVGARLATSIELPEGKFFDENLLKQLTGGDNITARHLYEREFTFKACIKLMISGNHKPIVKGTDNGFWRRINLVPFEAKIDNPDPQLPNKLWKERSGILNWCLKGWIEYRKNGLIVPDCVKNESGAYREEMDIIKQWKEECLDYSLGTKIKADSLYQSYKDWCLKNGFPPVSSTSWGNKVKNHLGNKVRNSSGKCYCDYTLKIPSDSN